MISVEFDADALADQVGKTISEVISAMPGILDDQANLVVDAWRAGASGRMFPGMSRPLNSETYRDMIHRTPVELQGDSVAVRIYSQSTGKWDMPAAIEEGWGPFDMKTGLLEAPSAKMSKTGARYNVIPFRHGAGAPRAHFATSVSKQAIRTIDQKGSLPHIKGVNPFEVGARRARIYGPIHYKYVHGLSKSNWYPKDPTSKLGLPMAQGSSGYLWKNRMFEGLQRNRRSGKGQSQFLTFRTVSDNSDKNSWLYPRVAPNPVFASMAATMEPIIRKNVEDALRNLK